MDYLLSFFRGVLKSLPIWLAAISAFFASLSALSVYQGEKYRLEFERLKLTYELMQRYADFETKVHTAIPCIDTLTSLDDPSVDIILNFESNEIPFKYAAEEQAALLGCMEVNSASIQNGKLIVPKDNALGRKIKSELDHMDALLIAYKYDVGVRPVICENLIGLMRETTIEEFLKRLKRMKLIDQRSHYPNVFGFVTDIEKMRGCPSYKAPKLERNRVLEALEKIVQ